MFLEKILLIKREEAKKIKKIIEDIKELNIEKRSLINSLSKKNGIHIIAEIKRSSPSLGIIKQNLDIAKMAISYQEAGSSAISIVTDETYFSASWKDIKKIKSITNLPILAKDFIIHPIQLELLKKAGADAVLFIMRILDEDTYFNLFEKAKELNLDVLVEVHNLEDIKLATKLPINLIGVNRRDLNTLTIKRELTAKLFKYLPKQVIKIAESGIENVSEIKYLKNMGYAACLIGTALLRSYKSRKLIFNQLKLNYTRQL